MGCGKLVPIITKAGEVCVESQVSGALASAGSVAVGFNQNESSRS